MSDSPLRGKGSWRERKKKRKVGAEGGKIKDKRVDDSGNLYTHVHASLEGWEDDLISILGY